jgi:hypothetical protein
MFWLLLLMLRSSKESSYDRYNGYMLASLYERWIEAGKPEGQLLAEFMQKQPSETAVSNRVFLIGGTNFVTQFALTKPKGTRSRVLFVTQDGALIRVNSSGRIELFSKSGNQ